MNKLYILLTVHNRYELTTTLLKRIEESLSVLEVDYLIVLNDDNSSDETRNIQNLAYKNLVVSKSDGNQFWCRGMITAYEYCCNNYELDDSDNILCINNDIGLFDEAFQHFDLNSNLIQVGKFLNSNADNSISYGGFSSISKLFPLKFAINDKDVVTFNMNFVMIPYHIIRKYGFLDPVFHHGMGDIDLGLRYSSNDVKLNVINEPLGICSRNCDDNTSRDKSLSVTNRIRKFHGILECPPKQRYILFKRWGGRLYPLHYLLAYIRVIF